MYRCSSKKSFSLKFPNPSSFPPAMPDLPLLLRPGRRRRGAPPPRAPPPRPGGGGPGQALEGRAPGAQGRAQGPQGPGGQARGPRQALGQGQGGPGGGGRVPGVGRRGPGAAQAAWYGHVSIFLHFPWIFVNFSISRSIRCVPGRHGAPRGRVPPGGAPAANRQGKLV